MVMDNFCTFKVRNGTIAIVYSSIKSQIQKDLKIDIHNSLVSNIASFDHVKQTIKQDFLKI